MKENLQIIFDKFYILECLKKDEHSAVYIVTNKLQKKKLILKVLDTKNLPDDSILERFKREAKILSQLNHPNIINVLEYGIFESSFYITFEYFEGKNLRKIIKENQLKLEDKVKILAQIFSGLAYAHENKVIHRDIKPENILVSKNLEVKLIDFGLAYGFSDNFVTTQNSLVGTPGYMSPEQILGDVLTPQSDLFSAGIVAYELLMNVNPFLGLDVNETINRIISFNDEAEFLKNLDLPENMQVLLKGLLKKDKNSRIKNYEEILQLLGQKITKSWKYRTKFRFKPLLVKSAAVFLIIVLISFIYLSYFNKPDNNIIPEITQDTLKSETEKGITLSSDSVLTIKNPKADTLQEVPTLKNALSENLQSKNELVFTEVKKTGELYIECIPWADIYIDSVKRETTPLKSPISLTEGEHLLELRHPNYPKYISKIFIAPNNRSNIKINLDTLFGYLDLKVYPWSEVIINNKSIGQTPFQKPINLQPGNYEVILKNNRYEPAVFNIKISQNETYVLKYNFELKQ